MTQNNQPYLKELFELLTQAKEAGLELFDMAEGDKILVYPHTTYRIVIYNPEHHANLIHVVEGLRIPLEREVKDEIKELMRKSWDGKGGWSIESTEWLDTAHIVVEIARGYGRPLITQTHKSELHALIRLWMKLKEVKDGS